MGIVNLSAEEMESFRNRSPDEPSVLADQKIRAYAERTGGLTFEYWRLAMGRIWGDPYMMTVEEVAKRLNRPVADLKAVIEETNVACGWRPARGRGADNRA